MSGELRSSHRIQNPTEPSSRVPVKRSYIDYLKGINTRFKQLSDNVLPASPYLLTVPTDRPFHLGSQFVSNWAVGDNRPFAPEEEHLQYMTFLSHQGEDTLLVAVGDWSDERGNIMEEDTSKPPSINTSAATDTSKINLQRKKISLSDYKKKANETPRSSLKGATDRKNGAGHATTSEAKFSRSLERPSLVKQSVSSYSGRKDTESPAPENRYNGTSQHKNIPEGNSRSIPPPYTSPAPPRESPSPNKKARLSTTKESTDNTSTKFRNGPPVVPALLSPTLPPTSIAPKLPRLLSPTLPPDIEEELAKIEDEEPSLNGSVDSKKITFSASGGPKPERPPSKLTQSRAHSNSTSSSSDKCSKARILSSSTSRLKNSSGAQSIPASSDRTPRVSENKLSRIPSKSKGPAEPAKPKLIVKLRYGRANRKRIEALLRFSGKYKTTSDSRTPKQKDAPEKSPKKGKTLSSRSADTQCQEKRPRQTEDDDSQCPAPKRRKPAAISSTERPRTPVTATFKSPSIQQQSTTSKSQFLTPNKDVRGHAMRRLGSGDGDARTPAGMDRAMNTSTPGSAGKTITKHSPPISTDSQTCRARDSPEYRQWRDEFLKYISLGRELKHASQRYTGPQATDVDEKLGAAIAVESVLCFILAFILEDQAKALCQRVGDSAGWRSIVAYWNAVKHITAPYPHLHGLCAFLGAVSHDAIHAFDLERLLNFNIPSENSPVPTPNSDGNTINSEDSKKSQREFKELRTRLFDSHKEAKRLWLEGMCELSEEVLSRQYPTTWSKRSKNFLVRGREKLLPEEYSGEYFLPLGHATTPVEVVRFGLALLTEWTEREGVRWKGRLGL
ncbi:uncharacterized protein PADG_08076 [Paracoccidioides brasiliensis Pb18]|uniref:Ell binding protein Ebp1 C-terminal domain-containing protein n=1 Tax=Paracoccidioides brasiliensis (strain Pb18) TaxID=502780 RepID=C1GLE0_PARBD|nr:uncharacterized protein PADG_08076 [Paracoccidioides brasiliensis Pb18]EEH43256.1 hypothetical protein PADG_08076 [Paracoccidioides brasiliensis Pb18]